MRRKPAVHPTVAYLHAVGLEVDLASLPAMFEEALREMRHTLYPPDPAADLPEEETAALRRGGFRMTPARGTGGSALAQTAAEYAALMETSLAAGETARRLGVDPSRVRQLLAARKIYGLQVRGAWRIPLFQFDDSRLLPGLEEVVPHLPASLHPVAVYRWFTSPNSDLVPEGSEEPLSPREWLLAGYSPEVPAHLAADLDNL